MIIDGHALIHVISRIGRGGDVVCITSLTTPTHFYVRVESGSSYKYKRYYVIHVLSAHSFPDHANSLVCTSMIQFQLQLNNARLEMRSFPYWACLFTLDWSCHVPLVTSIGRFIRISANHFHTHTCKKARWNEPLFWLLRNVHWANFKFGTAGILLYTNVELSKVVPSPPPTSVHKA